MGQRDARDEFEVLHGQMTGTGVAGRTVVELAGVLLGKGNVVGQCFDAHASVDHQHVGKVHTHGDRRQVFDRVIRQRARECGRHGMRARQHDEAVTIRPGLGDKVGGNAAACASARPSRAGAPAAKAQVIHWRRETGSMLANSIHLKFNQLAGLAARSVFDLQ
jgi:hypothetical protein